MSNASSTRSGGSRYSMLHLQHELVSAEITGLGIRARVGDVYLLLET